MTESLITKSDYYTLKWTQETSLKMLASSDGVYKWKFEWYQSVQCVKILTIHSSTYVMGRLRPWQERGWCVRLLLVGGIQHSLRRSGV